jgi:hypothetical protein
MSPAISTVIITAAVIVMVLVAMVYANSFLNARLAENEFGTNKQFMLTSALQIDDIAWTIGRTQTVRYSSRYGAVAFQPEALTYNVKVYNQAEELMLNFSYSTGVILFNMPTREYTLGNDYFERIFPSDSSDQYSDHQLPFVLSGSTAAISHVYVVEKLPMGSETFTRVAISPTIRMLNSTINDQNYVRFYMPSLVSGANPQLSQSVTLIGKAVSPYMRSNVTRVEISVTYPASDAGFDADFFRFYAEGSPQTLTLDSSSSPPLPMDSAVEFYVGTVAVSLGLYT